MVATAAKAKTEHPILFSGPMVRAILEGRKTQTRRVVKIPLHGEEDASWVKSIHQDGGGNWIAWSTDAPATAEFTKKAYPNGEGFKCPYGQVGDRLWVRETFVLNRDADKKGQPPCFYRADWNAVGYENSSPSKPSIFMPRNFSRITLEITNVRVGRLQEISQADAIAEGLDQGLCAHVFKQSAGKVERSNAYWLEHSETSEEESGDNGNYCRACALKQQKRKGKKWLLMGDGGSAMESDGPAFCGCGTPLLLSLTEYGIERELRIEDDPNGKEPEHFPVSGMDARIVEMIADGIGDLRDEHLGRLAQIGFATGWNSLNAKRGYSWESNPWVWAITFKRLG